MTADSDTVPSDFLGDVGQLCVIHQALISRKARPSVPVGEQVFHRLADIIFINIIMNASIIFSKIYPDIMVKKLYVEKGYPLLPAQAS